METATRATIRCWPTVALVAAVAAVGALALTALLPAAPAGLPGIGGFAPGGPVTALRWALLVVWAMAVAADERALGPLVLREPLVAAAVGGLLMGQPGAGWIVGLILQSIWPGLQPLGGSRPPLAGCASVLGVLWLSYLPAAAGAWRLPLALIPAFVAAEAGVAAEDRLRARNDRRETRLAQVPPESRIAVTSALVHLGLLESALAGAAALWVLGILPLGLAWGLAGPAGRGLGSAAPGSAGAGREAALLLAAAGVIGLFALGGRVGHHVRSWRLVRPQFPRPGGPDGKADGGPARPGKPESTRGGPGVPALSPRRLWALVTLQASFGNQFMQRSGFLHFLCLGPARGQTALDIEGEILAGGPINTQPVLAAALLGAAERVVHDARDAPPPRPPGRLFEVGGPLLAQWGDRAIWGALGPGLALVALAGAALWPGTALVYGLLGTALGLIARVALYRWGWRRGWEAVKGGTGWGWRRLPAWGARAQVPLAILAALALGAGLARTGRAGVPEFFAPAKLFSTGTLSFILGVPLGAILSQRPTAWAWACGAAGTVALVLGSMAGW